MRCRDVMDLIYIARALDVHARLRSSLFQNTIPMVRIGDWGNETEIRVNNTLWGAGALAFSATHRIDATARQSLRQQTSTQPV